MTKRTLDDRMDLLETLIGFTMLYMRSGALETAEGRAQFANNMQSIIPVPTAETAASIRKFAQESAEEAARSYEKTVTVKEITNVGN